MQAQEPSSDREKSRCPNWERRAIAIWKLVFPSCTLPRPGSGILDALAEIF